METPSHLLAEIQQQTADLAATIHRYEQHYGPLPISATASALLTTLLSHIDLPPKDDPAPPQASPHLPSFTSYLLTLTQTLRDRSQTTLSDHYRNALSVFQRYCGQTDISFADITPHRIKSFEVWLLNVRGLKRNTTSFYMRQLRAVYNRAVKAGLAPDLHPFAEVYTGVDRTQHRALSLEDLRRIKQLDLSHRPELSQARDLFFFSYYTRGMSFIDIASLHSSDLTNNQLTYSRRKTHQSLTIQWEPEMQELLNRLNHPSPEQHPMTKPRSPRTTAPTPPQSSWLITNLMDYPRLNTALHRIGQMLQFPIPLTMYVARHTWASIAFHKGIPVSVIGQALGHSGTTERTTSIYLASMNHQVIDRANRTLIKAIGNRKDKHS